MSSYYISIITAGKAIAKEIYQSERGGLHRAGFGGGTAAGELRQTDRGRCCSRSNSANKAYGVSGDGRWWGNRKGDGNNTSNMFVLLGKAKQKNLLTDEAARSRVGGWMGGFNGKRGHNLEKRRRRQYRRCESEAANRLLDFQFICEKKAG